MNPFDRVHRTFAFKRILGSVEKAWGGSLNEAYLRRTYLREKTPFVESLPPCFSTEPYLP